MMLKKKGLSALLIGLVFIFVFSLLASNFSFAFPRNARINANLATTTFTDVPTSHWAYKYITQAAQSGWVAGTGNNQYNPESPLTNAQFTKMLTSAFYCKEVQEMAASDGMGKEWWRVPCMAAWFNGVLDATTLGDSYSAGYEVGNYTWDEAVLNAKISRYDMAQMSLNIMSKNNFTVTENQKKAAQATIGDWATIPAQFRDAVSSVYALKVINGMSDGNFAGNAFVTRAQAAVILCRLAEATGKATVTPPVTEPPVTPAGGKDANGNTLAAGVNAVRPTIGKSDAYPTSGVTGTVPNRNGYYSIAQPEIGNAKLRYEFLDMVNAARAAESLDPVQWVPYDEGEENTLRRANELTIDFSHGSPTGGTGFGSEVIGQGYGGSAELVFTAWMNSPGHKKTLMHPDALSMCSASAPGGEGVWVITVHKKYSLPNIVASAETNYLGFG